jgi:RNA polymerase sigma factor (sigma-70 family)
MDNVNNANEIDISVIRQAAGGNDRAFEIIYNSLAGKMFSLCLRYADNTEDAEDFFQEGFIKLYRNLSFFRKEGSFEGWARRIFVTTSLDLIRSKKNKEKQEKTGDIKIAENGVYDKMSMDYLLSAIQKLPVTYRTILNLSMIEGFTHKEIGEMIGIEAVASKAKLYKARVMLKKLLGDADILDSFS